MRRPKTAAVHLYTSPVQTKFLRLTHAVPVGHRIDGWRACLCREPE